MHRLIKLPRTSSGAFLRVTNIGFDGTLFNSVNMLRYLYIIDIGSAVILISLSTLVHFTKLMTGEPNDSRAT